MRSATTSGVGGEIFQIATNAETSVLELAGKLRGALRHRGVIPGAVRFTPARIGDVRRNYSATSKARGRLGWTCRVPLEEGLDRTVDWFLRQRLP